MINGDISFTSNLEYNDGSWLHPPSLFIAWGPVFLISTASFTPLEVQSVSLTGNFTQSQSMVWFSYATWSVITEVCNSVSKSFFLHLGNFSSGVFTSFFCSFSLSPYLLSITPVYMSLQSLHGTLYTTPKFSCSVRLSFRCTSILLSARCSFIDVATP